ncbi:MAG: hypothetical protein QW331_04840 [Candidatus Woesearchaeota archaeon]
MKQITIALMVLLMSTAVFAQFSKHPDYVKCSEYAITTPTGIQKAIEIVTAGGNIQTYYNTCKNINYLLEYSCKNQYPATPVKKKCPFICLNDGCSENFAATVASSPYEVGKFTRVTTPYKIKISSERGEPELISTEEYKKEVYVPFAKNFVCSDTDGGTNENKAGTITVTYKNGAVLKYKDICSDKMELTEYRCDVSNPSSGSRIYCTYGCYNGACKPIAFKGHYGVQR